MVTLSFCQLRCGPDWSYLHQNTPLPSVPSCSRSWSRPVVFKTSFFCGVHACSFARWHISLFWEAMSWQNSYSYDASPQNMSLRLTRAALVRGTITLGITSLSSSLHQRPWPVNELASCTKGNTRGDLHKHSFLPCVNRRRYAAFSASLAAATGQRALPCQWRGGQPIPGD